MNKLTANNITGLLLLDKPLGLTSNAALQQVKRLFNSKKAGHTGSLDPLATGMLPLCFGHATKFSQYLLDSDKTYDVVAKLGEKTTTGDAEGAVIERGDVSTVTEKLIEKALFGFLGESEQIPSMYSAIKHEGQPLYKLARQGIEVPRKPRRITINEITLLHYDAPSVHFVLSCTKGTYVRSLVEDLGVLLGCQGHVAQLRRLKVGGLSADQMVSMEQLESATLEDRMKFIQPIECAVKHFSPVQVPDHGVNKLKQGQTIASPSNQIGMVALYSSEKVFLGLGEIKFGKLFPKKCLTSK